MIRNNRIKVVITSILITILITLLFTTNSKVFTKIISTITFNDGYDNYQELAIPTSNNATYNNLYLPSDDFADPTIIKVGDTYYMYATDCLGTRFTYSNNFRDWSPVTIINQSDTNVYACYWAPEIYYYNGLYYLFNTGVVKDSSEKHILVSTSTSPAGPFTNTTRVNTNVPKPIDNNLLFDDDGRIYMYSKRDINNGNTTIFVEEMNTDLITMKSSPSEVLKIEAENSENSYYSHWERSLIEAPYVFKKNGIYYLLYSTGWYNKPTYTVGYAISTSPTGPFTKVTLGNGNGTTSSLLHGIFPENQQFDSAHNIYGTGHNTLLKVSDEEMFIIYHSEIYENNQYHHRKFNADYLGIGSNGKLFVNGPSTVYQPLPSGSMGLYKLSNRDYQVLINGTHYSNLNDYINYNAKNSAEALIKTPLVPITTTTTSSLTINAIVPRNIVDIWLFSTETGFGNKVANVIINNKYIIRNYPLGPSGTAKIQLPEISESISTVTLDFSGEIELSEVNLYRGNETYSITYNLNGGNQLNPKTSYSVTDAAYTLVNPTKSGYSFSGWTGSNGTTPQKNVTIPQGSTGNKTYTANWSSIGYSITYKLNGGSQTNPKTSYTIDDTFTLVNPTKTGYTFTGWTGSNGQTPQTTVTIPKGTTGNLTYTANWEKNSYTLTYTLNGGTQTNPKVTYTSEETFTLVNPTKTGYTFTGWTGSNGQTPQKEVTIPKGTTGNKAYTANWSINHYTISYNLNGGTQTKGKTDYTTEETFTLVNPVKANYTFKGWTGSNGTTPQKEVTIPKGTTGNLAYTANWGEVEYTITYNLDGGIQTNAKTSYTKSEATFTLVNPTKTGYTFTGWTGSNGNVKELVVKIPKGSTGNKTYTANYSINQYTFTFDSNGGSQPNQSIIKKNYNTAVGILPTTTKTGYQFVGWFTKTSGGDKLLESTPITENKTFYARWEPIKYSIEFKANEGTGTMDNQVFSYDESKKLTPKAFTRLGYVFNSWNTKSDGSGTHYSDEQIIKNLSSTNNTVITLYAIWELGDYRIDYNLDGGFVKMPNRTAYFIETNTFTINNPEKEGYTFIGWTGSNGTTPELIITIPKGTIGNKTYKANYTINKYIIKFKNNDKTEELELEYNTLITIPKIPEKIGYQIEGWQDELGSILEEGSKVPAKDKIYTPKYRANKYTVIYHPNGTTGEDLEQVFEYDKKQALNSIQYKKEGYTFLYWSENPDGTGKQYKNLEEVLNLQEEDNSSIDLYAIWKKEDLIVKVGDTIKNKISFLLVGFLLIIIGLFIIKKNLKNDAI